MGNEDEGLVGAMMQEGLPRAVGSSASGFARDGVVLIRGELASEELAPLEPIFAATAHTAGGARQFDIDPALISRLLGHAGLEHTASRLQGHSLRLVRVVVFDKTPSANWFVPWHQDRSIAVTGRCTAVGYDHWTFKGGCHHVEPPVGVLEDMVALRLHFDRCAADSGPLEVIPGSHRCGRLNKDRIAELVAEHRSAVCIADRGDLLAMRPLIVHRSQRATKPARRRVLHLEYAAADLPEDMIWAIDRAAISPVARNNGTDM